MPTTTTALDELKQAAQENGWTVADLPALNSAGVAEWTRVNPDDTRRREYLRAGFDALGGITHATWSPAASGIGARRPAREMRAWALIKLNRRGRTTADLRSPGRKR